jgi:hypothetical protein
LQASSCFTLTGEKQAKAYISDLCAVPETLYAYDLPVPNGRGQLGSVSTGSVVTRYTAFDAMGNITQSSQLTGTLNSTQTNYITQTNY